jgi:exodeoxyribonuclease V beta subunit
VHDIGRLVVDHLGPDDPLLPWAEGLADGTVDVGLAGHLTGSIDAVLRVGGDEPRFVIVDYKTNRLGRRGEVAGPDDYAGPALAEAMAEHDYPLQALLYSVALHRYLRWRLAGYDPARHLGGAAYLFVRGMSGPGVPVRDGHPDGVFSWAVPPGLVTGLSDLLDGRTDEGAPA